MNINEFGSLAQGQDVPDLSLLLPAAGPGPQGPPGAAPLSAAGAGLGSPGGGGAASECRCRSHRARRGRCCPEPPARTGAAPVPVGMRSRAGRGALGCASRRNHETRGYGSCRRLPQNPARPQNAVPGISLPRHLRDERCPAARSWGSTAGRGERPWAVRDSERGMWGPGVNPGCAPGCRWRTALNLNFGILKKNIFVAFYSFPLGAVPGPARGSVASPGPQRGPREGGGAGRGGGARGGPHSSINSGRRGLV